jgi:hypothetical protein
VSKKKRERKKLDILSIYKGIRKPTPPPTRVEDKRRSRTRDKHDWQHELEDTE